MAIRIRHAGGLRALVSLPTAATIFCILQFLAVEARAHVRAPKYNHLDRRMEADKQGTGNATRLEHQSAHEQGSAKTNQICGLSFGGNRFPADATLLAASMLGAQRLPLSEVRLDSVRANEPVYREVLPLLDGFIATSAIVLVAEGVAPDGGSCPLYISVGSGRFKQTFWRFAPDDEPEGWFDEGGRRLGDATLAQPKPGSRISSPFGPRRYYGRFSGGGFHDGIDYEARVGEPIFAAADGVIEHQGGYFEYGLTIKIRHAAQYTTLYAHMSRFASGIAVGARVRKGELIGYVGMTGRSTGAHLHFSTIVNGKFVDPAAYLSKNGDRSLTALSLATFRKWQQDIRAAVKGPRDRQRRHHIDELDWTTRT
jgi:hypothetical protein